jgi:hypothetical protein
MAIVNITKAAKLAGVTRTTIYKKLSAGELSKVSGGKIDTSELERVFGPLTQEPEQAKQKDVVSTEQLLTQEIEFLKKQVNSLERDKNFLQEQLGATLLLENKTTAPKEPLLIKVIKAWRKT